MATFCYVSGNPYRTVGPPFPYRVPPLIEALVHTHTHSHVHTHTCTYVQMQASAHAHTTCATCTYVQVQACSCKRTHTCNVHACNTHARTHITERPREMFPYIIGLHQQQFPQGSHSAVNLTFSQSLWKAYCGPNTALGSGEITVKSSCLCGVYILEQRSPVEHLSMRVMSHIV